MALCKVEILPALRDLVISPVQAGTGARRSRKVGNVFRGLFPVLKDMSAQSEKEKNKAGAQVDAHCEIEELLQLWKPNRRARIRLRSDATAGQGDAPYHFGFGLLSFIHARS